MQDKGILNDKVNLSTTENNHEKKYTVREYAYTKNDVYL